VYDWRMVKYQIKESNYRFRVLIINALKVKKLFRELQTIILVLCAFPRRSVGSRKMSIIFYLKQGCPDKENRDSKDELELHSYLQNIFDSVVGLGFEF
jgi:hypothetical protein